MINKTGIKKYFLITIVVILSACDSSNHNDAINEIVFLADKTTANTYELYGSDVSGNNIKKLSHDLPENGDVIDFSLSPDGKYVAYRATSGNSTVIELFITNSNGSRQYKVSGTFPLTPPVAAGVGQYAWSPDSAQLAYLSRLQDGNAENTLYLTSLDTELTTHITPQTFVGSIHWSPDSRYIAFSAAKTNISNSHGVYIYDKYAQTEIKATGDLLDGEVLFGNTTRWSPDNTYVSYMKRAVPSTADEVFTVLADGTELNKISNGVNSLSDFSWSPDSRYLAYLADQDTPGVFELSTIKPDATENRKISILQSIDEDAQGFSWAPDGSRIAYRSSEIASGYMELYTVTPDNLLHTKVSGFLDTNETVFQNAYYWSPDSRLIAYLANPGTVVSQLFIVNPDSTSLVAITNSAIVNQNVKAHPIWSPDSNYIAFNVFVEDANVLFAASSTGQSVTQASQESKVAYGSVEFQSYKWFSDSKHLIYKAKANQRTYDELFSVSIETNQINNVSGAMVLGGHVVDFDTQ